MERTITELFLALSKELHIIRSAESNGIYVGDIEHDLNILKEKWNQFMD